VEGRYNYIKIFIVCSLYCSASNAQTIYNVNYFQATKWASYNKDSSFFKSDTIKLVKVTEHFSSLNDPNQMDLADYFGNDYVLMKFKKRKQIEFYTHQIEAWTVTTLYGKYSWDFNLQKRTLDLFFKDKLLASFIPMSEREVSVKSNFAYEPTIMSTEVTLIRSQLISAFDND